MVGTDRVFNILVPIKLQELSKATEEGLVKCLEMCADFNYPMGKKKLQNLVQSYCVENNVHTRDNKLIRYRTLPVLSRIQNKPLPVCTVNLEPKYRTWYRIFVIIYL
jgi:hypothetical protein